VRPRPDTTRSRPKPDTTRLRPRPKKICEAEAELCEAEARDAVFTMNY